MDKIWDRKSFEVGGHHGRFGGVEKKPNDHESKAKKKYLVMESLANNHFVTDKCIYLSGNG